MRGDFVILVFDIENKTKLEEKGCRFICKQIYDGNKTGYLLQESSKVNFEELDIKYLRTNKMNF